MKALIGTLAATLLAVTATMAQPQNPPHKMHHNHECVGGEHEGCSKGENAKKLHSPEQKAHNQAARMKELLSLSDKQEADLYALFLDRINAQQAAMEKIRQERLKQQKEMLAAKEAFDKKMKGILSDDQYQEWEEHQAKMRANFERKHTNWQFGPSAKKAPQHQPANCNGGKDTGQ